MRRADILSKTRGLAAEVHFEYANELAYTLEYSYDLAKREVSWKPKLGAAAGVSGFARFDDAPSGGTQFAYALAYGAGRTAAEQELGNLAALVAAFVTWVSEPRR